MVINIIVLDTLAVFVSTVIPTGGTSTVAPVSTLGRSASVGVGNEGLGSSGLVHLVFKYRNRVTSGGLGQGNGGSEIIVDSVTLDIILFLAYGCFYSLFLRTGGAVTDSVPCRISVCYLFGNRRSGRCFSVYSCFLGSTGDVGNISSTCCVFGGICRFNGGNGTGRSVTSRGGISRGCSSF